MKKIVLLIFLFSSISVFSQVNDTVNSMGEDCLRPPWNSFDYLFANDSIYIWGVLRANCDGPHTLIRYMEEDSIQLFAADSGFANCICPFEFSTAFLDNGFDEYNLVLGYVNLWDSMTEYYIDTTIYRNPVGVNGLMKEKKDVKIFPNPVNKILNIKLLNSNEKAQSVVIRNIINNLMLEKITINNKNTIKIDLSKHKSGIYLLEIITDQDHYFKEIMII